MIIGTFFAIALGLYFGIPLLKVLILSALLQSAIAVGLTRSRAALLTTSGVLIAAVGEFFLVPFFAVHADQLSPPISLEWFTFAAYAIAVIGLVSATVIGLMGRSATGKRRLS
jgi:hypothetical protein